MNKAKQLKKDLNVLPKIVIVLDGGLVQDILVNDKSLLEVEVYTADYDIEGYDGNDLFKLENAEAVVYKRELEYYPKIFKYLTK